MGNNTGFSSSSNKEFSQLIILYECEQGEVIAEKECAENLYLMRDLIFSNEQSLLKVERELEKMKGNEKIFAGLIAIEKECVESMCGGVYRLRLFFEYSRVSINDEIEARRNCGEYMELKDCYRLVIGCLRGFYECEEIYERLKGLNAGLVNRVFVNGSRILLMKGGVVKILNPLMVSGCDRWRYRSGCYYSPEKIYDFDYEEDAKCGIFELGVTLMHIINLKDAKGIYNGFEVKRDEIELRIMEIEGIYGDSYLCELLRKMTETIREERWGIEEAFGFIDCMEKRLDEMEGVERMEDDENMNDFFVENEKMKRKSYCIDYFSTFSDKEEDRYEDMLDNHINKSIKLNSNQNDQSTISNEKENVFNTSNFNIKSNFKSTEEFEDEKKIIKTFQELSLSSETPLKTLKTQNESIVITNGESKNNFEYGISLMKSTMMRKGIERGKESYQYGDELKDGIFSKIKNSEVESKCKKVSFERKRTYFSKYCHKNVKKVNNNDRMSLDDDDFKDKFIDKDMLMENKEMRMWRNGS